MDVVTKATAEVSPVEGSKSKHGEFDVILSTSSLDRDGDELHPDEWKTPLPERITFDSDHGMSVATCVGSGKPFINEKGQLQVRGTFASTPHGQAVRTLVNEGHIDRVSVAFRNLPKTSKDARTERELLNGAFVAVPANTEARVLSSKAAIEKPSDARQEFDLDKKDAPNWRDNTIEAISAMFDNDPLDGGDQTQKTAYFQGVHDLAVKLGAGCPYSDPQATPGVLSAPGNRSLNDEVETKSSPTESTDSESAAAAPAAAADEESADDVAQRAKQLAMKGRANIALSF